MLFEKPGNESGSVCVSHRRLLNLCNSYKLLIMSGLSDSSQDDEDGGTTPSAAHVMVPVYHNGDALHQGEKGPFSIRTGRLDAEVLEWLRTDEYWNGMRPSYTGALRAAGAREEASTKSETAGHLFGPRKKPGTLNGARADHPMFGRLRWFVEAFRNKNKTDLEELGSNLHAGMQTLPSERLGANGTAFLNSQPNDWLFRFGTIQVLAASPPRSDPKHMDGGSSLFIGALTLWGNRRLNCWVTGSTEPDEAEEHEAERPRDELLGSDGLPALSVLNTPGSMYIATLCSAQHQVHHDMDPGTLTEFPGLGPAKVTILLRCSVFRSSRGSVSPNPTEVYNVVQDVCARWLAETALSLPSLAECQQAEAGENSGESAA